MPDAPLTSGEVVALAVDKLLSNDGHSVKVDPYAKPRTFRDHAEEVQAALRGTHPGYQRGEA